MILSAQTIRQLKMVFPFYGRTKSNGMTFGLSCAGYDVRIAQTRLMWPGRFVLASTCERFKLPGDVAAVVHDKSTWARRGITVQNTVLEPGWEGFLTLEISNHSWGFRLIRNGDPIAQIVFHRLDEPTDQPYDGKYQNQPYGPVPAILEEGSS